jgi:hypothetical protein
VRRQAPTVICTEKTRTETHDAHVSEKLCTAALSTKTSKGGAGTAAVRARARASAPPSRLNAYGGGLVSLVSGCP